MGKLFRIRQKHMKNPNQPMMKRDTSRRLRTIKKIEHNPKFRQPIAQLLSYLKTLKNSDEIKIRTRDTKKHIAVWGGVQLFYARIFRRTS